MSITPIETGRYGSPAMRDLFQEDARYQRFLDIEAALARVQARHGLIPVKSAEVISERARIELVPKALIASLEQETRHELAAVIQAFSTVCGDHGRFVHYGATSSDIIDTATVLQLRDACKLLERKLMLLLAETARLASTHAETVMVGRTHGQHATPITFGFKSAIWADELMRHLDRLAELRKRLLVGKMSGAVGSSASFGAGGSAVQSDVMKELGLAAVKISNQAISRDRLAEFFCWTALTASTLETIATEVRNLQRPEISELSEPFASDSQIGSSTMPHKRNPVASENICSLSRLLRSFLWPAFENIALWHERDLTNSANERFTIPQACILLDEILEKGKAVLAGLQVGVERMRENLRSAGGRILAEVVMLELVRAGADRARAYRAVQKSAFEAEAQRQPLGDVLSADPWVRNTVSPDRLRELLHEERYVGECASNALETVRRCVLYLQVLERRTAP